MSTYTIGNWVTFEDGTNHQITGKSNLSYTFDNNFSCGFETHTVLSMKLWQPKPGDWCWFHNGYTSSLLFAKFYNVNEYGFWVDEDEIDIITSRSQSLFKYCEPFIGQLPSICKEC